MSSRCCVKRARSAWFSRFRSFVIEVDPRLRGRLLVGLSMRTFCFRERVLGPPKSETSAMREFRCFPAGLRRAIDGDARLTHFNQLKRQQREFKQSVSAGRKQDKSRLKLARPPSFVI